MISRKNRWIEQVTSKVLQVADTQLESASYEVFLCELFFLYLHNRLWLWDLLFWRFGLLGTLFGILFGVFLFLLGLLLDLLFWGRGFFRRFWFDILLSIKDPQLKIFGNVLIVDLEQTDGVVIGCEYF